MLVHLIALHEVGSNNPLGIKGIDFVFFYPYFYIKDLFGFIMLSFLFSLFVFFAPNDLGHPDNYIEANSMVTPAHIVPEWYFLPFYAILRSIPDKLGGVLAMGAALIILLLLPFIQNLKTRSPQFRPLFCKVYWIAMFNLCVI